MLTGIIGTKIDQTQAFLEDGRRIPLSMVSIAGNWVTQIKNSEKDKYTAVQLGFGTQKKANKAEVGHSKKAGKDTTPRFFREVRMDDTTGIELGQEIDAATLFEPGDVIDVTGTSKGKGFAGVVKKYNFRGGPKTHGQSDRHRARGSSGSGTTPGRVYKGKRMAGRMGNETVTVKNLVVVDIKDGVMYVKGLIPGIKGAMVVISKVAESKNTKAIKKNFVPLFAKKEEVAESQPTGIVVETVEVEALPEVHVEEKPATAHDIEMKNEEKKIEEKKSTEAVVEKEEKKKE